MIETTVVLFKGYKGSFHERERTDGASACYMPSCRVV